MGIGSGEVILFANGLHSCYFSFLPLTVSLSCFLLLLGNQDSIFNVSISSLVKAAAKHSFMRLADVENNWLQYVSSRHDLAARDGRR